MDLTAAWANSGRPLMTALARRPVSFKWRIAFAYSGLLIMLGLLLTWITDASMSRAVHAQIDRRLTLASGELADMAAVYMSIKPAADLRPLVERYARYDGVAYVFIEDDKGVVTVSGTKSLPAERSETRSPSELRQVTKITRKYYGRAVEETRAPMPGRLGIVHIGVWRDAVEAEVRKTVRPVIGLIALVICAGIAAAILLAHSLTTPIRRLTTLAERLSTGDLETPVSAESNDEIADLARSLERMRASLKTAINLRRSR
ncbi:MAG TPA: HAMP domain-containing protein [Verrucomicrobiae bacterium]|jgi:HAMP domain-containing protein|nr:HAMP domain-containing protein [Verrucomicrobiae bacterium]